MTISGIDVMTGWTFTKCTATADTAAQYHSGKDVMVGSNGGIIHPEMTADLAKKDVKALSQKAGTSTGHCPRVRFGDVYAQHVHVTGASQVEVVTPVVGYGMKGDDGYVDITLELPANDGINYVYYTHPRSWYWLCDCESDCSAPGDQNPDSRFYSGTNSCGSPGDNCCKVGDALFKCPFGSDCCNGFCCPPNSVCQTCGGVTECSAPQATV